MSEKKTDSNKQKIMFGCKSILHHSLKQILVVKRFFTVTVTFIRDITIKKNMLLCSSNAQANLKNEK